MTSDYLDRATAHLLTAARRLGLALDYGQARELARAALTEPDTEMHITEIVPKAVFEDAGRMESLRKSMRNRLGGHVLDAGAAVIGPPREEIHHMRWGDTGMVAVSADAVERGEPWSTIELVLRVPVRGHIHGSA